MQGANMQEFLSPEGVILLLFKMWNSFPTEIWLKIFRYFFELHGLLADPVVETDYRNILRVSTSDLLVDVLWQITAVKN
jgi:hypothetical protein